MKFTKVRKRRVFANLYHTTEHMDELFNVRTQFAPLRIENSDVFIKVNADIIFVSVNEGFVFDGATAWPDKWILEASMYHDAMGRYLPDEFRAVSDEIFRLNVKAATNKYYARLLWLGVRAYSLIKRRIKK